MRTAALLLVLSVLSVACASGPDEARSDAAATPGAERAEACSLLLRDLRYYCREGLRARNSTTRFDCLSRRLEFEERCL